MSKPRFLLDEHVWGDLVKVGNVIGVDVLLIQTQLPEGSAEEGFLAFTADKERGLLTGNANDFAPLVKEWYLAGKEHWGVTAVSKQTNKSQLSRALRTISDNISAESLKNSFRFIQKFI